MALFVKEALESMFRSLPVSSQIHCIFLLEASERQLRIKLVVVASLQCALDRMQEHTRMTVAEVHASEAVTAAVAKAGETEVPVSLVLALIRSSPLMAEGWGYVSPSLRADRVAAVAQALDKTFAGGSQRSAIAGIRSGCILVSDLLRRREVARITEDASVVVEACKGLPFLYVPATGASVAVDCDSSGSIAAAEASAAARADSCTDVATTGTPRVVVLLSVAACIRKHVEFLMRLVADDPSTGADVSASDAMLARYLRQVASRTPHGCLPAAVLCAAPQLKLLKATPTSAVAALKGVDAHIVHAADASWLDMEAGTVLVPHTPASTTVAAVYLGDGHDGRSEFGIVSIARTDVTARPLALAAAVQLSEQEAMLGQEAEEADDADDAVADVDGAASTAASASSRVSDAAPEDEEAEDEAEEEDEEAAKQEQAAALVSGLSVAVRGHLETALQFHLHPARLRFTQELLHEMHELDGWVRPATLLRLPRVRRAAARGVLQETAAESAREVAAAAVALIAEELLLVRSEQPHDDALERLRAAGFVSAEEHLRELETAPARVRAVVLREKPSADSVWIVGRVPWMRCWVPAPGAGTTAARLLAEAGKTTDLAGSRASHLAAEAAGDTASASAAELPAAACDASDTALVMPGPPTSRLVSNVGEDDSSLVEFMRSDAGAQGAVEQTNEGEGAIEDEQVDDEETDADWAAVLERLSRKACKAADIEAADVAVQEAERADVAALAARTLGQTPWQADSDAAAGRFSVMSFNILADAYAVPSDYKYAPRLALAWGWRRSLIVAEILFRRPSILAMQEVESWIAPDAVLPAAALKPKATSATEPACASASIKGWQKHAGDASQVRRWGGPEQNKHAWFAATMAMHGYETYYARKVKSQGVQMAGHTIGNALFWRKEEFECVSTQVVSIADEAGALYDGGQSVWSRGFPQVAAVAHLRHRLTGKELLAAAMHLTSDYTQPGIQACQALALRIALRRISAETGVSAIILAGDANDTPDGSSYLALRTARISSRMAKSAAESGAGKVPTAYVVSNQLATTPDRVNPALPRLVSTSKAAMGREPPFTVASPNFTQTLDYIFASADQFVVEAALDGVPRKHVRISPLPTPSAVAAANSAAAGVKALGGSSGAGAGSLVHPGGLVGLPTIECPSDHLPVAAVLRFATKLQVKRAAAAQSSPAARYRKSKQ